MSSIRQNVGAGSWFAVRALRFVGVVAVVILTGPCFLLFWFCVYAVVIPYTFYQVGVRGRRTMFEYSEKCDDHP